MRLMYIIIKDNFVQVLTKSNSSMKKIKCLFMVILTLGFFALSANAQDAREVRKQERAKKMKARKTLKARPNPVRQAKVITYKKQVVVQVKPSDKPSKKGEFKKRPNPTKSTELTSTVTVTTNRGERSVRKPFKQKPKNVVQINNENSNFKS